MHGAPRPRPRSRPAARGVRAVRAGRSGRRRRRPRPGPRREGRRPAPRAGRAAPRRAARGARDPDAAGALRHPTGRPHARGAYLGRPGGSDRAGGREGGVALRGPDGPASRARGGARGPGGRRAPARDPRGPLRAGRRRRRGGGRRRRRGRRRGRGRGGDRGTGGARRLGGGRADEHAGLRPGPATRRTGAPGRRTRRADERRDRARSRRSGRHDPTLVAARDDRTGGGARGDDRRRARGAHRGRRAPTCAPHGRVERRRERDHGGRAAAGHRRPAGGRSGAVADTGTGETGRVGVVRFEIRRAARPGDAASRVETVAFAPAEAASVLWLTDAPGPRTLQWTRLRADARISWFARPADVPPVPVDATRPLDAEGLLVGRPLVRLCRVEHTRVGEPPVWRVTASEGQLPDELTVTAGEVVNLDEEVAYRDLELRFEARPGTPGSSAGTLVVRAAGHPRRFEVPYRVVVPPGRVVVRLETPGGSLRLPAADDAAPWALVVEEESPNAPPLVRVEAVLAPPSLTSALTARLAGGGSVDLTWDLTSPLALRPGRRYDLHLDLAPGVREAAGTLALRLPEQRGVTGTAAGRGTSRPGPRGSWSASHGVGLPMRGGEVVGEPAPRADRGLRRRRRRLAPRAPAGRTRRRTWPREHRSRSASGRKGPGRWAVVPRGDWHGARGDTFSARQEAVPVTVRWSAGAAPERRRAAHRGPPALGPRRVRPRGAGRAGPRAGLWSLLQMKAAPVDGTLLYQVEGRERCGGRLDLAAAAGRGSWSTPTTSVVSPSRHGPIAGVAPVVVVRPTRVGAVLEIPTLAAGTAPARRRADGEASRATGSATSRPARATPPCPP